MVDFKHKICEDLYKDDAGIDRAVLENIISLGAEAIEDLELILKDAAANYAQYLRLGHPYSYCPIHAFFLLAELGSTRSLGKMLAFLSQPTEKLDYWFGDMLGEDVWEVIFKCGRDDLQAVESFLRGNQTCIYARGAVSKGLVQLALHGEAPRDEVVEIFRRTFDHFAENPAAISTSIDPEEERAYLAFLICDCLDLGARELEGVVLGLFDKGLVDTQVVAKSDLSSITAPRKKDVLDIFKRYKSFQRYVGYDASEAGEDESGEQFIPLASGPLTERELDWLDEFLLSEKVPEGCLDICSLDGFLHSLVVGPETLPPSRWMPYIWNETEEDEMVWDSTEEAHMVTGLIMRHYNSIAAAFEATPPSFTPIFGGRRDGEDEVVVIQEWCWGFMHGVHMCDELWSPLLADTKHRHLMTPLVLNGTENGWKTIGEMNEKIPDEQWAAMMPGAIEEIHRYWRKISSKGQVLPFTKEAKTGRNDPCTCGSGKKFKKCCGAPERLH